MKNKKPKIKFRNWTIVDARTRHTAGAHTDKKKKANKNKCRGKVRHD